jgi:hypothetical protein
MKTTMHTFHRFLQEETFAIKRFGRGSLNHLLFITNIERLKFRQLSTREKQVWVKANSGDLVQSLPDWGSMTIEKKASEILASQVRAFGAMRQGPFASVLTRDYSKAKWIIEWKMEVACHSDSDSMLPPDAPPEPQVDERASLLVQLALPAGETTGLFTQEHLQPSGASKQAPICVLSEQIKKQEEVVYVLGATQPQSSAYRRAVEVRELMWFLSLDAAERQIWMNKFSTPAVSQSAGWAGKSEVERAKIIIMSRVKDLECTTGIPQVVLSIGKRSCPLFSIGKEDDGTNADA